MSGDEAPPGGGGGPADPAGKPKVPAESGTGEVEVYDGPAVQVSFSAEEDSGLMTSATRRRLREWPGSTILDHAHPYERILTRSMAGALLGGVLCVKAFGALGLAAGFLAALLLFVASRGLDIYWVASPAEGELVEVLSAGLVVLPLRRFPFEEIAAVRLGGWEGVLRVDFDRGAPNLSPFHFRELGIEDRRGQVHALTYAERHGPHCVPAAQALARRIGVPLKETQSRQLGQVTSEPGRDKWSTPTGLALGAVFGAALAWVMQSTL